MKKILFLLLTATITVALGCSSVYYSAWEALGKQKRDLLRDQVVAARKDQVEASQQFKDALTVLRETYPLKSSNLQKAYDQIKRNYDRSEGKANELKERIDKMHSIATALFREWKQEANSIKNRSLQERSLEQLEQTRNRYEMMREALKRSQSKMDPILGQFRDHVLFLKHSLNAQALGALQGEADEIQAGIESLIQSIQTSIAETDDFISTLSNS